MKDELEGIGDRFGREVAENIKKIGEAGGLWKLYRYGEIYQKYMIVLCLDCNCHLIL